MKKIFYFLASAIVALGAMACQNEVDENITPENTNEITFNVSFDESTRIAMGELADGKLPFVFDGKGVAEGKTDSLYVGYNNFDGESYDTKRAALTNTEAAPLTFTADQENMSILNQLVGADNVYAVNKYTETVDSDKSASGLLFRSEIFEVVAGENNITLSLACPALYFTVPTGTEVALSVKNESREATLLFNNKEGAISELTFGEGTHIVGINTKYYNDAIISYSIGKEVMKEKLLTDMTNKVYNLGTLGTVMTIADVAALIAEADSEITLPAGATITGSEILTIDKNITINGNGATLRSTAGRAINVSGEGVEVAISNLNIECTGERGVNVIQSADRVTLTNVNITAANYAVNVAGSAAGAEIIINGGEYNGLCTVNVAADNANVTITGATINSHSETEIESYAALMIGDYTGSTISVEESTINISGTSEIAKSANKASHIFVDDTEVGIPNPVAKIVYGDYAYLFETLEEALEYAKEDDTVILLDDAVIAQEGEFKIDLNGHYLTPADGYVAVENGGVWTVVVSVAKVEGIDYGNLADALTAAGTTKVVTLLADATNVATACVINANGHALTTGDGFLALKNYNNANGYYDVVAVTKSANWHMVGDHIANSWQVQTKNTPMYEITGTNWLVVGNITLEANKSFKLINGTTWDIAAGSPSADATADTTNQWFHAGTNNIYITAAGTYNIYYDTENQVIIVANIESAIPELTFKTYYLNTGGSGLWNQADAWFCAHLWTGSAARDYKMVASGEANIFKIEVPIGFGNAIFLRMNSSATDLSNIWNQNWNKTNDLTISGSNNCYTITGWGGADGKWSTK